MMMPNFSIIPELKTPPKKKIRRYTIGVSYPSFEIIRHGVFSSDLLEPGN